MVSRRCGRRRRAGGRRAAADLYLLPSGAAERGTDCADAADGLRADHRRNRPGVSGVGGNNGAAPGARQKQDPRRRDPLPSAVAGSVGGAARWRARRHLPDFHRRLRGDVGRKPDPRRAVPGGDPARPPACRAHAGSRRAGRLIGADVAARRAARRAHHAGRRRHLARVSGPQPLGQSADRRGLEPGGSRAARAGAAQHLRRAGRDRGVAYAGGTLRGYRLAADRRPLRRADAHPPFARDRAQSRRRRVDGRRARACASARRLDRQAGRAQRLSYASGGKGRAFAPYRPARGGGCRLPFGPAAPSSSRNGVFSRRGSPNWPNEKNSSAVSKIAAAVRLDVGNDQAGCAAG